MIKVTKKYGPDCELTQAQIKTITFIATHMIKAHMSIPEYQSEYEFKKFEVEQHQWANVITPTKLNTMVYVIAETGRKGDEGTMAAVYARNYRVFAIGRCGGVKLVNAKTKARSRGRFNALHARTDGY